VVSVPRFYAGLTQNISGGGLFVATHHLRNVGDRMTIRFTLPDDVDPIFAQSEVRWIREITSRQRFDGPTGMGLQFISLSAEAALAIERFLPVRESASHHDE
jgi:uncharacterized protein (TIGR02266 family)